MNVRKCVRCIALVFVLSGILGVSNSLAQQHKKEATGSISGRITLGDEPVPHAIVMLMSSERYTQRAPAARATTDEDGRYRLSGVRPGNYIVLPHTPTLVPTEWAGGQSDQLVTVGEGEDLQDVDFSLNRGGVITGRVTDADGKPVIAGRINLMKIDDRGRRVPIAYSSSFLQFSTDDRGVYRLYGLPPGHYKVSLGDAPDARVVRIGPGSAPYARTFHPDVADEARATIIEVTPGSESTGVDISVGRVAKTYVATGRIMDADTGAPLPNLQCGYGPVSPDQKQLGAMGWSGNRSNSNGEFRLEGLPSGRFAAFLVTEGQTEFFGEPVVFEIADADVSGLEIKVRKAASISGVVVIEGTDDAEALTKLPKVELRAFVQTQALTVPMMSSTKLGAGGSFRLTGLQPGKVMIQLANYPPIKGFWLLRTERDGAEHREGIELGMGEQLTGVRLVLGYGTGVIRGQIKFEGREKPPGLRLRVIARRLGGLTTQPVPPIEVDSRGRFTFDGLAAGDYEVATLAIAQPGSSSEASLHASQRVSVVSGSEAEVTLMIKVKPIARDRDN